MKAVFITYNEAHSDSVLEALDKCFIRGFTRWEQVEGRGSRSGEPHLGSHAWPTMNAATITFVDEDAAARLKKYIKELDEQKPQLGLRLFTWTIDND